MQNSIVPTNYTITLEPNFNTFIFRGTQVISLHINNPITECSLDCLNIEVFSCYLLNNTDQVPLAFSLNKEQGVLKIVFDRFLVSSEHRIEIEFEGQLNDKLAGFYRSQYYENKQEKFIATTQFEAADARQAFPCFDAPEYKATFNITLVVDPHLTAISNMPVISESLEKGKKKVVFKTTPIMSTYLVYCGVGDFEIIEDSYKDVLIRAVTTKGKSTAATFALDCTKKSLEFFEEYFGYAYPLPKLDIIAAPDFASGAMENWGAITFRENAMLFYEGKSSLSTRQRVAEVVCHELAHQWFGNLVTMRWWDDLWLNESFATFMSYKVMDHYWPKWDIWSEYLISTVFDGMNLDKLRSSHPIKVTVNDISEINELFDEIAYDKGGSVLRMVEKFMGQDKFRDGLREYIKDNVYKNTEAQDLWTVLEKYSPKSILNLITKFITQTGFPEVSVAHIEKKLCVSQKRFLWQLQPSEDSQWSIPLILKKDKVRYNQLLEGPQGIIDSTIFDLQSINDEYSGFYITNYSEELLKSIGKKFSTLNSKNKLGIIHDLYQLTLFGKKTLNTFIDFIELYLSEEKDAVVLYYLIEVLNNIYSILENERIKKAIIDHSKQAVKHIGLDPQNNNSTFETFLRATSLSSLVFFDDSEISLFLTEKFKAYLKDENSIPADLKMVTYMNAVWTNPGNHAKLMKIYEHSEIQEEKVKILNGLIYSKDTKVIIKTLDYCLTEKVRFSNVFYVLSGAAENPFAKQLVLDWLISNWNEFKKRIGGHGGTLLRKFVKIVVPICAIEHPEKATKFLVENKTSGLEKTFLQVQEELDIHLNFIKRNK